MAQVPRGREDLICPFHKQPQSEVCHKCPLWVQIRGADPQTGQATFDEWACAFGHMPMLLVNNAQQSRQAGASADKVANEIDKFRKQMVEMNEQNLALQRDRLIGQSADLDQGRLA